MRPLFPCDQGEAQEEACSSSSSSSSSGAAAPRSSICSLHARASSMHSMLHCCVVLLVLAAGPAAALRIPSHAQPQQQPPGTGAAGRTLSSAAQHTLQESALHPHLPLMEACERIRQVIGRRAMDELRDVLQLYQHSKR